MTVLTRLHPDADAQQLLDDLKSRLADATPSELTRALESVVTALQHGQKLVAGPEDAIITPRQAAEMIGISRPYLYRLLDRGAIPFERVGRDRRLALSDVLSFASQREVARRELAEKFASVDASRRAVIDRLVAEDDED